MIGRAWYPTHLPFHSHNPEIFLFIWIYPIRSTRIRAWSLKPHKEARSTSTRHPTSKPRSLSSNGAKVEHEPGGISCCSSSPPPLTTIQPSPINPQLTNLTKPIKMHKNYRCNLHWRIRTSPSSATRRSWSEVNTFRKEREETTSSVILQLPKGKKKKIFCCFAYSHIHKHTDLSHICASTFLETSWLSSTSHHISRFGRWEGKNRRTGYFFGVFFFFMSSFVIISFLPANFTPQDVAV